MMGPLMAVDLYLRLREKIWKINKFWYLLLCIGFRRTEPHELDNGEGKEVKVSQSCPTL